MSQMTKDFKTKSKLRAMHGGNVQGEGGPTDDKVGPVMLSDEEYVLPADTADAIGRDKLDALRAATHDFKDKGKGSALRAKFEDGEDHLADGGSPWTVDRNGTVSQPGQRLGQSLGQSLGQFSPSSKAGRASKTLRASKAPRVWPAPPHRRQASPQASAHLSFPARPQPPAR